tara:strand:- start:1418 stop:1894 length:477 start_codon:yes stop_codon:yes gene_type:complete
MTNTLSIFNKLRPVTIGLDSMFSQFERMFDQEFTNLVPAYTVTNYPPYNIVKVDENAYEIYVALAGISKDDIKVYKEGNTLVVELERTSPADEKVDGRGADADEVVIHRGISQRYFKRAFTIADDVKICGAELKDGMLKISLEKENPFIEEVEIITVS